MTRMRDFQCGSVPAAQSQRHRPALPFKIGLRASESRGQPGSKCLGPEWLRSRRAAPGGRNRDPGQAGPGATAAGPWLDSDTGLQVEAATEPEPQEDETP